jgi:Fe2+ transport system protein FeoA
MQKTCGLPICNHTGTVESCGLNQLGVGCQGCVVSVGGDVEVRRRLLEMGFCNGAKVEVVRRAPLGDPIEFRLRGYHLSLRDEQAQHVAVTREPASSIK